MTLKIYLRILFTLLVILPVMNADLRAQGNDNDGRLYFSIESGIHAFAIDKIEKDYIRSAHNAQGLLFRGIGGSLGSLFTGAKAEYLSANRRFTYTAGVRYSYVESWIVRRGVGFLYVLHRQSGTTTEYLRVRSMIEKSHFIGIPVEVRYLISDERKARWFVGAGGGWAHNVASSVEVNFINESMSVYEGDVKSMIGEPSRSYVWMSIDGGLRIESKKHCWTVGLNVPVILSKNISSLVSPIPALGAFVEFAIPHKP